MKVAIIGGSAKKDCGLLTLDRSWEFWGLNLAIPDWLAKRYVRLDRWFHIHRRAWLKDEIPEHLESFEKWAEFHDEIEFILAEPFEKLPNATIFPREELSKMPRGAYHCCSFDWMIAYALHLGAKEIFLAGINMRNAEEPISATPCIEYWCGYAEGLGVKVTAGTDCDLFYNYHLVRSRYVYGYDKWDLVEDRTKPAIHEIKYSMAEIGP